MKKSTIRIILTVLIILVLAIMIFYPKIKPLFSKDAKGCPDGQADEGRGSAAFARSVDS